MASGDGEHRACPVKFCHKDAAEDEPTHDADKEAVQLPLEPNPHELLVPDGHPEHDGEDGAHEGGDEHAGDQHHAGVLHQTCDVVMSSEIR